jgi:hypothetical protein
VSCLQSLSELDVRSNQIAALPAGLGCATALADLRLGFNQLTELPASMSSLRGLRTLDLRNNLLQVCGSPCAVAAVENTHVVRTCMRCGAVRLPVQQHSTALLRMLSSSVTHASAHHNAGWRARSHNITHTQEFPVSLCSLQLALLDLANNSLRALPPALGAMTSLRSLPLDGNPLKLMRRGLWAGACAGSGGLAACCLRGRAQHQTHTHAQRATRLWALRLLTCA